MPIQQRSWQLNEWKCTNIKQQFASCLQLQLDLYSWIVVLYIITPYSPVSKTCCLIPQIRSTQKMKAEKCA
jgi:hypothetical protein